MSNQAAFSLSLPQIPASNQNDDLSWMSIHQKRLYEILIQDDNCMLSGSKLREKFNLSRAQIEGPAGDQRFAQLWNELKSKYNPYWMYSSYEQTCLRIAKDHQEEEPLTEESLKEKAKPSQSPYMNWKTCRYHREFINELIKLGVNIAPVPRVAYFSLDAVDTSWMNKYQLQLLDYMRSHPETYIRSMNQIAEICNCSSLAVTSTWIDSRFKDIVEFHNKMLGRVFDLDRCQKMYEFYLDEKNRHIHPSDAAVQIFGDRRCWYQIQRRKDLVQTLEAMGVTVKVLREERAAHEDVTMISSQADLEAFYASDVWDTRKLFKDYPRHRGPGTYIVDFTKIPQPLIRETIKRFYRIQVSTVWKPRTANANIVDLSKFFVALFDLFPDVVSLPQLDRETHVVPVIQRLRQQESDYCLIKTLTSVRAFFNFACVNGWKDAPKEGIILSYDLPRQHYQHNPKPLSSYVKAQFDDLLHNRVLPALRKNENPPFIDAALWDFIIILRYTGRRYEDVAHLLSDCLQFDADGDPVLFVDHRIAKIPKDLYVPLAHLNGLDNGKNIVVEAIGRQQKRVENLPPVDDGYHYLFRHERTLKNGKAVVDVYRYDRFGDCLTSIIKKGEIQNEDGTEANISSHQFRHTVASEMIAAGVDVYAVKEFLGHESVRMTENYIRLVSEQLKKKLPESAYKSDIANSVSVSTSDDTDPFSTSWVKNKLVGVFELGDGCCEHPYKLPSCPHMVCKTCIKKKIYPRHRNSVVATIESTTAHIQSALQLGLTEKAAELQAVLDFHEIALVIIDEGKIFSAAEHYYKKRGL